jgi:hypothetical protein
MGIRKLPSTAGIDGIRKKEHHDLAVRGERFVIGVGREQVPTRRQKFESNE